MSAGKGSVSVKALEGICDGGSSFRELRELDINGRSITQWHLPAVAQTLDWA